MPFGDCCPRCRSVDHLVRSEIIFGLGRNCFSRHNCTRSVYITLAGSFHHLSGAPAVALIILQVGALVGTVDIRPELCALSISNYLVRSQAFLEVRSLLLLQVCLLSLVWVSISHRLISSCHSLRVSALQDASSQPFWYGRCLQWGLILIPIRSSPFCTS